MALVIGDDGAQLLWAISVIFFSLKESKMFHSLTRAAMGAALLVGAATAQQRSETVPVTTTDPVLVGFEADCYGTNFSTFSLVGYVARVGTFNFGSGTIASVPHLSTQDLQYTNAGFKFSVIPQWVWGAWCAGLGTVTFEVKY